MIDFKNGKFSRKSLDFLSDPGARLNILHGSVRSGKTVNCDIKWLEYCVKGPPGDLLMAGKTVGTLQRNVLNDIADLVGPKHFKWTNRQQGEAQLLGRRVHMVGANSEEAESKIRGSTLAGALCDEISMYPRSFVDMLLTRLSVPGAQMFANCNPDSPNHWFYTDFIINDRITNKKIWKFVLDDNPNLDKEYRQSLEESFDGVFYERFILGNWVVAEGAIYRKFVNDPDKFQITKEQLDKVWKPFIKHIIVGVDFGSAGSGTAFTATGYTSNYSHCIVIDEEYREAAVENPETLSQAFVAFVEKLRKEYGNLVREARCDSNEGILIRGFRLATAKAGIQINIMNALKGSINNRIRLTSKLMAKERIFINRGCKMLIKSFQLAVWDPKKLVEDKRLDDGSYPVDPLDSFEYTIEPVSKMLLYHLDKKEEAS